MKAEHLEVLVEEPSMEACLRELLPKILEGKATFSIYPSQCKQELIKVLPQRLRGYSSWLPLNYKIVVVVDRDDDDCKQLKEELEKIVAEAGLNSRTKVGANKWEVVTRIAIEELEAWFFGDINALRTAYPRLPENLSKKANFRNPDTIQGGTWEALERELKKAGYYRNGLRKIEVAREIGKNINPHSNTSRSFQVFRDAILEAVF